MSAVSPNVCVNDETTKVKLLENSLKLQKLRTKRAKEQAKLEANHRRILQRELGRLKLDFFQIFHRLDMLDASILPAAGSMDDLRKVGLSAELFGVIYINWISVCIILSPPLKVLFKFNYLPKA